MAKGFKVSFGPSRVRAGMSGGYRRRRRRGNAFGLVVLLLIAIVGGIYLVKLAPKYTYVQIDAAVTSGGETGSAMIGVAYTYGGATFESTLVWALDSEKPKTGNTVSLWVDTEKFLTGESGAPALEKPAASKMKTAGWVMIVAGGSILLLVILASAHSRKKRKRLAA